MSFMERAKREYTILENTTYKDLAIPISKEYVFEICQQIESFIGSEEDITLELVQIIIQQIGRASCRERVLRLV